MTSTVFQKVVSTLMEQRLIIQCMYFPPFSWVS